MRLFGTYIRIAVLSVAFSSCAPSGPSTLEILNSLEAALADGDKNGAMALFADDVVIIGTQGERAYEGTAEIEIFVNHQVELPQRIEFRDIEIEGDTATFIWALVGTLYTSNFLAELEVQNGEITSVHILELETTPTSEE